MRCVAMRIALAAALAAVGLGWHDGAAAAERARTHRIVIQGLQYVPATLDARRGDVVVWVNKDPFPHTATAPGGFDSGPIAPGGSWRFTVRRSGGFAYVCTLHSNMKGMLQVD